MRSWSRKVIVTASLLGLLWLVVGAHAIAAFGNPDITVYWRWAQVIPAILVALNVSVFAWIWARRRVA